MLLESFMALIAVGADYSMRFAAAETNPATG
jgi:hypothetical protein